MDWWIDSIDRQINKHNTSIYIYTHSFKYLNIYIYIYLYMVYMHIYLSIYIYIYMYAYNTVPVIPSGIFKFCTLTSQLFYWCAAISHRTCVASATATALRRARWPPSRKVNGRSGVLWGCHHRAVPQKNSR